MIKIDQIREIVTFMNETSMQGGFRVIIIHPAHAMNHNSANALLKTLEEPTPNSLLILISDQHTRLPATITSRCQKLIFNKPALNIATQWLREQLDPARHTDDQVELLLRLANGAPLKALALLNDDFLTLRQEIYQSLILLSQDRADPLTLAAKWHDGEILLMLGLLLSWLRDLLRFKLTYGQTDVVNRDYIAAFSGLVDRLTTEKLLHFIERVQFNYAKMLNLQNLNRQLLLEELFIRWTQIYVPG
jgi:DNA polymerase-3 subunit delta'